MDTLSLLRELHRPAPTKIILLVLDGLGGLPIEPGGPTALEAAETPNLDRMAKEGTTGLTIPVLPGITPGSGPAHLALFGLDPLHYDVGRGVLEATGTGMQVAKGDIAARGNFCTIDDDGNISDRRAGRLPTEEAIPLVQRLAQVELADYSTEVRHLREYRFAVVLRGEELEANLSDTDPQQTGKAPLKVGFEDEASSAAAAAFNHWIEGAFGALEGEPRANGLTLRGFSTNPELPQLKTSFGLRSACVAVYPMYRGAAKLVGMDIVEFEGEQAEDEFSALAGVWNEVDFAFIHIKAPDSRGEDGNFSGKAAAIEAVDRHLELLIDLEPAVVAVTGDHSTPARLQSHSWHPVPLLLWAPQTVRPDASSTFGESSCARGGLGTFRATYLMQLLLAHAERLDKYGA